MQLYGKSLSSYLKSLRLCFVADRRMNEAAIMVCIEKHESENVLAVNGMD